MAKNMAQDLAQRKRAFLAILTMLLVLLAVFLTAQSLFRAAEIRRAEVRLSLYHATLNDALARYRHLPEVLAKTQYLRDGVEGRALEALNIRLAEIAADTDLEAIYVMDSTGDTVAASNAAQPYSFVGNNYGFRPYFYEAMQGNEAQFFAIGVTTMRPGYFLSAPVHDAAGSVAGVIAIKVDLSALTHVWAEAGEDLFVSNADQVVVLSSDESWLYETLTPLAPARREQISAERQFVDAPLTVLDWRRDDDSSARLLGRPYLHLTRDISIPHWTLHFLVPKSRVWANATITLGAATGLMLALLVVGLILRARRIRTALAESQADRRQLRAANTALNHEVEERRAAEVRAEKAQSELAQSSKLAALGQLAASVTHELGQPISAMKNHLAAAEIGAQPAELKLVDRMSRLVMRMENITRDLRFFARPTPLAFETFTAERLWRGTEDMMAPDFEQAEAQLNIVIPEQDLLLTGNRLRLEQVLVNLLKNAMLASQETNDRRIEVTVSDANDAVEIRVRDYGPGLKGRAMSELQEPFHTTRASGEGMGLGLAISAAIVKEHGGSLRAEDCIDGASILLRLPKANNTPNKKAP
jgi:two-component system C4-dicarboxylate transport sensor histidine kinase DctB